MSELSKTPLLALTVAFVVSAGLYVAPAIAQEEEMVLEEVIVTAQRREQSVMDVPISITAFTSSTIEANMIQNVENYFDNVAKLNHQRRRDTIRQCFDFQSKDLEYGVSVMSGAIRFPTAFTSMISMSHGPRSIRNWWT